MLPVEKNADWRRKREKRAIRRSDSVSGRCCGEGVSRGSGVVVGLEGDGSLSV